MKTKTPKNKSLVRVLKFTSYTYEHFNNRYKRKAIGSGVYKEDKLGILLNRRHDKGLVFIDNEHVNVDINKVFPPHFKSLKENDLCYLARKISFNRIFNKDFVNTEERLIIDTTQQIKVINFYTLGYTCIYEDEDKIFFVNPFEIDYVKFNNS